MLQPSAVDLAAPFADYDKPGSPGCVVGVSVDGEIVHIAGHGLASIELDVPIGAGTAFNLASTSKQFAAFATILLASDGLLSLDDDVARHVPSLDFGTTVTLRQLMHHNAGVRDYFSLAAIGQLDEADYATEDGVVEIASRQRSLNFPPGTAHSYSNTGYVLLARVVRAVSGRSLAEFARERIFEPLGMKASQFSDDARLVIPGRATGYMPGPEDGTFLRAESILDSVVGDGGLVTTAGDLLRWCRELDERAVFPAGAHEELVTEARLADGTTVAYAGGLSTGTWRGARWIGHGGAFTGWRADVVRFVDHGLAVTVLANVSSAPVARLARQVAALYLGDVLEPDPLPQEPIALPVAELERWVGAYAHVGSGAVLSIDREDDRLALRTGAMAAPLEALAPGRFRVAGGADLVATFEERDAGRALDLGANLGRFAALDGEPIVDPDPAIQGSWYSHELDATWTIEGLDLVGRKDRRLPMKPVAPGCYQTSIGTVRTADDGAALTIGDLRGWRVRFERRPSSGQPTR